MKCSGKQQPYLPEIDALNKKRNEEKFARVVDQAEVNKKNLEVLDDKINSSSFKQKILPVLSKMKLKMLKKIFEIKMKSSENSWSR